jgi:hypothetical protein
VARVAGCCWLLLLAAALAAAVVMREALELARVWPRLLRDGAHRGSLREPLEHTSVSPEPVFGFQSFWLLLLQICFWLLPELLADPASISALIIARTVLFR